MTELQINQYLERIGASVPEELSPSSLMALTRAHLEHVPFEVLEMTEAHREPSLEPEVLFEKIVSNRRGGYCFELNKLFYLLLKALGFSCHSVGVRVLMGRPEPRAISHRGIVVEFGAEKWYCDAGFGGRGPKGILRLEDPGVQTLVYESFRVLRDADGGYVIVYLDGDHPVRMLKFRDDPWLDVDFAILNSYYGSHSHSPFVRKRILYLCQPEGWVSLVGDTFTCFCRGETEVRTVTEDAGKALVAMQFGLYIPQWDRSNLRNCTEVKLC